MLTSKHIKEISQAIYLASENERQLDKDVLIECLSPFLKKHNDKFDIEQFKKDCAIDNNPVFLL